MKEKLKNLQNDLLIISMNGQKNMEILTQDLEYCIKAFESDNFNLMNIAANRLMENSIFLENEEVFLVSAILKDIAQDYMGIIQGRREILNSAKVLGKKAVNAIKNNFYTGIDTQTLWQEFQEYGVKINGFHKDELESKVYRENKEFTSLIFKKLLEFLVDHKLILKKINNTLINGILGVMVRIMKNHSFTLEENKVYLFFKLFAILYRYVIEKSYPEEEINDDDYKEYLEDHIDYIVECYLNHNIDIKKYNAELWKIGKQYRELYFLFNPPRVVVKTSLSEQVPALVRIPIKPNKNIVKDEKEVESEK